jgi:superfamily II DNA or RNA helicase
MTDTGFSVGTLVRARGREWVVLPGSEEDFLLLRPLGGEGETAGVSTALESIESAHFDLPNPEHVGESFSCRMLRDAARLSSRAYCGPLRCLGKIAVEPRPYQLVPLLMGLKLNPVRILIADDVGVGKTIEACLIARELVDRGEIERTAVLCPPHLAEQWQAELSQKFHIESELVLSSTASRLERNCAMGQSLFEVYPHVIVSLDFIKSDRRREEFLRTAPEFVIVDEAHTCAFGFERRGRHQRHELVSKLTADPKRHMVFVTATPHSGKEDAFRSLISFLDPEFADFPEDLSGPRNEHRRRRLSQHFVQRRRADIEHYLDAQTPFPKRNPREEHYTLHPEYKQLFDRAINYARDTVADDSGGPHRQRVRWWSALALLRALASSPRAAAATMRTRAGVADAETVEQVDEIGRRAVFDIDADEQLPEGLDVIPGSISIEEDETRVGKVDRSEMRLLSRMARQAESLEGDKDHKLRKLIDFVDEYLKDGFSPIVFCRFIPTAEYVTEELRKCLPGDVEVACVTGVLPHALREEKVKDLENYEKRVLVATDCLSEGLNLQESFNAVVHYDLSWNPTRHEQRDGRVDRFGQKSPEVRVLTYYGLDNQIDGIVLDVLLRKHETIRNSLGISVPVPLNAEAVEEAIVEGLRLRRPEQAIQLVLPGIEEQVYVARTTFDALWEKSLEREKRSRTMFAQDALKPDEVLDALDEAEGSIMTPADVQRFFIGAVKGFGGSVRCHNGVATFSLKEMPRDLRDTLAAPEVFRAAFDLPVPEGVKWLKRTHPFVESMASHVFESALDPYGETLARRVGAMMTDVVSKLTVLLLVRYRYDITAYIDNKESSQLAEESITLAYEGLSDEPVCLDEEQAQGLLDAEPTGNVYREQALHFVKQVVAGYEGLTKNVAETASQRAEALLAAHRRVRSAARMKGVRYKVEPRLPADILGIYVYLPDNRRRENA